MTSTNTYTITESQRENFKPTYLYIKQHSITGLKYFGKTVSKNPISYKGSGKYWKKHIKKHGKEYIETLWIHLFEDIDELVSFALFFSEEFDIIESKEWANLMLENGLHGMDSETSKKIQKCRIENGTHSWLGNTNPVHKQILLNAPNIFNSKRSKEIQKSRIENKTHHMLGGKIQSRSNKARIENKSHNFLGGELQKSKSSREIYHTVRALYKELNIKIPNGTNMKSDEYLEEIKIELELKK